MEYLSTRGRAPKAKFCDILLGGLAPDGGLYLPETYPLVTPEELDEWRPLPYSEIAFRVLSKFIDDIPPDDLREICHRTYDARTFRYRDVSRTGQPYDGDVADIAPLTWLERSHFRGREKPSTGVALLELSNGPTLAFKDMAMQLVGNLFEYVLEKRGETLNVLGATSGDTGSAAEYALRGKKGIKVFMMSPNGKMSAFQRAQMYGLQDANIFNIAINGMFDDAQDVVKLVSADADFKARYRIGAVNSINWARVAAQVVYYFKGYFAATESNEETASFAIPSGNFGNACAGHVARMMGLPVENLVVATNENDVLDEFFRTGVYRPRGNSETLVTSSSSMDISKASNFERLVFELVGRDGEMVRTLFGSLARSGQFQLSSDVAQKKFGFLSGSSTHKNRMDAIRTVFQAYGVFVDTHTADALSVGSGYVGLNSPPLIVMETAAACKFENEVFQATGQHPPRPAELDGIEDLPQRVVVMEPDAEAIKAFIAQKCDGS